MARKKYKHLIGVVLGVTILIGILYVVVIKCHNVEYIEDIEDVEPTIKSVQAENESLRKIIIRQNSLPQCSEHLLTGNLSDTGIDIVVDHLSIILTRDFLKNNYEATEPHEFCVGYVDGWKQTILSDTINNYFPYIWHGNIMLTKDEKGNEQLVEVVFVNEYPLQFTNDIIPAEYAAVEHIDMVHQYNSRAFSSGAFSFQKRSESYNNGYESGKIKAYKLWTDAIDEIEKARRIHVMDDINTVRNGNSISEQKKIERINNCPSVGAIYFLQKLLKK